MLTILTYHYVRDLPRSRYPTMKGLLTKRFQGQLDYIEKHYTVCGINQVVSASRGGDDLPSNACVLTFDDGLIDHYLTVFPILEERGLIGSFYPPGKALVESGLLNTHKIHIILASAPDHRQVVQSFFELLKPYRNSYDFPSDEELYRTCSVPGSDDDAADTIVLKRAQHVLPEKVRSDILSEILSRHVSEDEETLAKELYMDFSQLRTMVRHGMEIGGHGYSHVRLSGLSRKEQQEEISQTVDCLAKIIGHDPANWVNSHPFGKFDQVTVELLKESGCALGLGTGVDYVHDLTDSFDLNRLDTNDLPFSGDAEICGWTERTLGIAV